MMAAKALAPMGPQDLVTALYQLSLDGDEGIAATARGSADKLPENILAASLGDALDPRVLDFFAARVVKRPGNAALLEKVLLNRATDDQTFVTLSSSLGERELEIVAGNQQRLLRCPAIIEALYFNRNARMSTVDRVLELAVRHGLELNAIPQFKEIAAQIFGAPEAPAADDQTDAAFADAVGVGWEEEGETAVGRLESETEASKKALTAADIAAMPVNAKIRLAAIGNASHRAVLVKDSIRPVAMAAITSPAISEQEATKYAADRSLSEDVIREITRKKEWQKSYQIKLNLVNNPKTPLAMSLKYLTHLRGTDLRMMARSKQIPSVLAAAARRMTLKSR